MLNEANDKLDRSIRKAREGRDDELIQPHTPGPWYVELSEDSKVFEIVRVVYPGEVIAEIPNGEHGSGEDEANACLIAAAPALLEAAEAVIEGFDRGERFDRERFDKLRGAIRLARVGQ